LGKVPSYYPVVVITILSTSYAHGEQDCEINKYDDYMSHWFQLDIKYFILETNV